MTTEELAAAWDDLAAWWQKHGGRYNAPAVAAAAGLYKGRFYALMKPGSQGGSTARRTEQTYRSISDALSFRYYRPGQKAKATA